MSRYTAGCFVHDDIIEVTDAKAFLADERFKDLPPDTQDKVRDMIEGAAKGDIILAVQEVSQPPMVANSYEPSTITIAQSSGGGSYFNSVTIPGSLGKYFRVVNDGVNRPNTVPPNAKRENITKREEVDLKKMEKEYQRGHSPQWGEE